MAIIHDKLNETLKDVLKIIIEKNDLFINITPYIGTVKEYTNQSQTTDVVIPLPTYEFDLTLGPYTLPDMKIFYDINSYPPKEVRSKQFVISAEHYLYTYETIDYLTTKETITIREPIQPYNLAPFDMLIYYDYEVQPRQLLLKYPI